MTSWFWQFAPLLLRETEFFFFSLFLFFLIQLIIEALSVFGGPSYMILLAHNNSEGIIYKSQLKWGRKKKSSHLLTVVQFIIYTCTGIRWVSLCVMSHQGCNICLAGFRDATPHLVAVGNVHYCSGTVSGINWEQGEKNSVASNFALLKRQSQSVSE